MFKTRTTRVTAAISALFLFSAAYIFNGSEVRDQVMLNLVTSSLNSVHYSPKNYSDDFSEKLFDMYLERLDYSKKFLLQEDVHQLKKYRLLLDDELKAGTVNFFDQSHTLMQNRVKQSEVYYKEALEKPFSFNGDDAIETDPKKLLYPETTAQMKAAWYTAMKYQVMLRLAQMIEDEEKKDSTKKFDLNSPRFAELEKEAREKVGKTNADYFSRLMKINRYDRYYIYLNCIANLYDPHTEFFPPKDKKNFDIQMSGQLEGIGAQLNERDGAIKVASIVPGSPSWKQGQLKAGDIITKVAQGANEPVDITAMRLDDAIELIRGKKGTEVRLTVKKPDGSILVIPIIRDVVVLEETYARSAVIEQGNKKIGFIHLPGFYADFTKANGRNCSKDMKLELEKLSKDKVDGIVIDLRNNGGGSLQDVIRIMGYLIPKGPVVQVMQRDKKIPQVYGDDDPNVIYSGPLAIMVNENSASASEILAAAVQDYGRGVIIGSKSTFGKGTVQQFVNLDEYLLPQFDSIAPVGAVKLTIQKFYRVNGGSTQLKGVEPDIVLPDVYKYITDGEKDMEYPLSWDEVRKADYSRWNASPNIQQLRTKSDARVKDEPRFRLIGEWAEQLKKERDITRYSLNLAQYLKERKMEKEQNKKYDKITEEKEMKISYASADRLLIESDSTKNDRHKEWHKSLKKDVYVWETLNVLGDWK
ncbi:MAG: carboxy terminal-processing peptidase [Bacteroidia bacterium]|nr:carboxy terminal-processing peptidase [Bacteroidia bacterium]